jgi:hypothetical protein
MVKNGLQKNTELGTNMKTFRLSKKYIREVCKTSKIKLYNQNGSLLYDSVISTHFDNHPEFEKLRNKMEKKGYIRTERNWVNADIVLVPFFLNKLKFKKNEPFPCASAIQIRMELLEK